jgi:hypothetical protein
MQVFVVTKEFYSADIRRFQQYMTTTLNIKEATDYVKSRASLLCTRIACRTMVDTTNPYMYVVTDYHPETLKITKYWVFKITPVEV